MHKLSSFPKHQSSFTSAEMSEALEQFKVSCAAFQQGDWFRAGQAGLAALQACRSDEAALKRDVLSQVGNALICLREYDAAARCYRLLWTEDRYNLNAALSAAHCSSWSCDWDLLAQDFDRVQQCLGLLSTDAAARERSGRFSPFPLLTLTDDPAVMHWAAQLAFERKWQALPHKPAPVAAPTLLPRPGGRLRLGLLSGDFHQHATTELMVQVLEGLYQGAFEVCVYSYGRDDGSALRQRVRQASTLWREVGARSEAEVAAQVRADHVAVLLEMKGYTQGSRMMVAAYRAAPIQVSWLGYPGTTGGACLDYVVGDPVVTPLADQPFYTEAIAQMPHCYQPNDSARAQPTPPRRQDCQLPETGFVWASFNMPYKIVPEVFALWCSILRQTPGSVLWLLADQALVQTRLQAQAQAHGVDPQRLVFAPMLPSAQHRARLPLADMFLDSFPCSGHTTASDALWAGVPVLTLQGRSFASRVAASLLTTLGLPELVCDTPQQYLERAVAYGRDRLAWQHVRQRLSVQRQASPLFDGQGYARAFEALLLRMVDRHERGLGPAPLAAQALPACHPASSPSG